MDQKPNSDSPPARPAAANDGPAAPGQALVATPPLPAASLPAAAAEPFALVPVRQRHDGWTPQRQRAFIEALAETLSVAQAAARVGMSEASAYALRRRAGAQGFGAAWDAALRQGVRHRLAPFLLDQAVRGRIVRRFYHGQLISEELVHSERLLLALLARADRLFPPTDESDAALADWDATLDALESGAADGGYRVWQDRRGLWWTNFPPPPGFDNHAGEPEDADFKRPLTAAEEEALASRRRRARADGAAARDLYFGFTPSRRAAERRSRQERGR
jgi:hypothetical protein